MSHRRTLVAAAVLLLVGFALGAGAASAWASGRAATPHVLEGHVTTVNYDGSAIGLAPLRGPAGAGYVIAGAMWREGEQGWRSSFPTCLEPLSSGQRVRLGVIDAAPSRGAVGRPVVVWLECLAGGEDGE